MADENQSSLLVTIFVAAIFLPFLAKAFSRTRQRPFPPGPKTDWFGRVKLPLTYPWLTYARWMDLYGTLVLRFFLSGG
jgi:hypothetical protein